MPQSATLDKAALSEEHPLSEVSHLHIEMGYQCNFRCTFCYQVDFSARQNMEERIWREHLRPLYPTLKSVFIQGGEPTIMKNCIGLRDLLIEEYPQIKIGMVTNGMKFDERWQDAMLRHGNMLQVSLNGTSKKIYDRTMRFGDYAPVVANLERFLERRRAESSPCEVHLSYVIVPENVCELADFIALAAEKGADEVKFFTDQMLSGASRDTKATMGEIARAYEAAAAHPEIRVTGLESFEHLYRVRHGLMKNDPAAETRCACSRAKGMCTIPWTQIYVKHKGELTFCCMTWRNMGNLHEAGIEELWNNPRAREFRRKMLADRYPFCSPTCLANPKPDYSWTWTARKFASTVGEDPNLVWKKAKNKVGKMLGYRKAAISVDSDFPSVQRTKNKSLPPFPR